MGTDVSILVRTRSETERAILKLWTSDVVVKGNDDTNEFYLFRLLNLNVDVWVHLNCALWSLEVYETLNGALMNVEVAVKRGTVTVSVVSCRAKESQSDQYLISPYDIIPESHIQVTGKKDMITN